MANNESIPVSNIHNQRNGLPRSSWRSSATIWPTKRNKAHLRNREDWSSWCIHIDLGKCSCGHTSITNYCNKQRWLHSCWQFADYPARFYRAFRTEVNTSNYSDKNDWPLATLNCCCSGWRVAQNWQRIMAKNRTHIHRCHRLFCMHIKSWQT